MIMPGPMETSELEVPAVVQVMGALEFSGTFLHLRHLCRALSDRGTKPIVVTPGGVLLSHLLDDRVATVYGCIEGGWLEPMRLRRLTQRLQPFKPVLVHAQGSAQLRLARRLARRLGLPWVATVHGLSDEAAALDVSGAGAVIAVSEVVRQDLVNRRGVDKERIRVIPDGIAKDTSVAERPPRPPDAPVLIGALGRLDAVHGFDYLVEAAALLRGRGREVHVVIGGSGPADRALADLALRLDVRKHVTFTGAVVDPRPFLSAFDIFVLPSLREGLGQILMEAMAAGLPVVASGVGGVYQLVRDEQNGLIVPPRDAPALADAIDRLLAEPAWAAALARQGRADTLEHYDMTRTADAILDMYRRVLKLGDVVRAYD